MKGNNPIRGIRIIQNYQEGEDLQQRNELDNQNPQNNQNQNHQINNAEAQQQYQNILRINVTGNQSNRIAPNRNNNQQNDEINMDD